MNFVTDDISDYCEQLTKPQSSFLKELERETFVKVLSPQMISGHLQGQFLKMVSCMIRPKRILEIGTFTGYSAICMAEGLDEEGHLHTIDINEELKPMVARYIEKAGLSEKITLHFGDAREIIPSINETFDLVFIDADKENYCTYYDLVFDKLSSGGHILADNALWSGKVLKEAKDKETKGLQDYNEMLLNDNRVDNTLLPIRDGVMIARKL